MEDLQAYCPKIQEMLLKAKWLILLIDLVAPCVPR